MLTTLLILMALNIKIHPVIWLTFVFILCYNVSVMLHKFGNLSDPYYLGKFTEQVKASVELTNGTINMSVFNLILAIMLKATVATFQPSIWLWAILAIGPIATISKLFNKEGN